MSDEKLMNPNESPKGRKISINAKEKTGVRQLNSLPMILGLVLGAVIIAVIGYAMIDRSNRAKAAAETQQVKMTGAQNAARDVIQDYAGFGEIPASEPEKSETPPPALNAPAPAAAPTLPTPPPAPTPEDEEAARLRNLRLKALETALSSPLRVEIPNDDRGQQGPGAGGLPFDQQQAIDALMNVAQNGQGLGMEGDPNLQLRKESFMNAERLPAGYLQNGLERPLSPYEIKTGSIIPGVLVSGVNSDLPGQIIGQVSQDVYDTARGDHVLIPRGTRIVGVYDSQVAMGQTRVLVAWTRLVYPNGNTLELDSMPGADSIGYAGMSDKVDNHYFKIFGNAFLLSLITAGTAMAIPEEEENTNSGTSASQEVKIAIAQQMGQVGAAMLQKGLNIQPTLEIRPGYRFFIMVNKDMLLQSWQH